MPKPRKSEPEHDPVAEEDPRVVDDTEQEDAEPITEPDETPKDDAKEDQGEGEGEGEIEGEGAGEEASEGSDEDAPVESAAELSASRQRIAELEAQLAEAKQPAEDKPPTEKAPTAVSEFLQTVVPQAQKRFAGAQTVTVDKEGNVLSNPTGAQEQFSAIYEMTGKMLKAVMADHVTPYIEDLAQLAIGLRNEVEIRDLRAGKSGAVFQSMEKFVRQELDSKPWKARNVEGAVGAIFKRLTELRGAGGTLPKPTNGQPPLRAAAALRDISAGVGAKPSKAAAGFKLTPAQEADYADMVEHGSPLSREQYHAKWKARAARMKEQGRPIPSTYRSFSASVA